MRPPSRALSRVDVSHAALHVLLAADISALSCYVDQNGGLRTKNISKSPREMCAECISGHCWKCLVSLSFYPLFFRRKQSSHAAFCVSVAVTIAIPPAWTIGVGSLKCHRRQRQCRQRTGRLRHHQAETGYMGNGHSL